MFLVHFLYLAAFERRGQTSNYDGAMCTFYCNCYGWILLIHLCSNSSTHYMRVEFKFINQLIIIGDTVDEHEKKNNPNTVWFAMICNSIAPALIWVVLQDDLSWSPCVGRLFCGSQVGFCPWWSAVDVGEAKTLEEVRAQPIVNTTPQDKPGSGRKDSRSKTWRNNKFGA